MDPELDQVFSTGLRRTAWTQFLWPVRRASHSPSWSRQTPSERSAEAETILLKGEEGMAAKRSTPGRTSCERKDTQIVPRDGIAQPRETSTAGKNARSVQYTCGRTLHRLD